MVIHQDKKTKGGSWKGNPKPFEESLFSLTQERLSSHKFVKSCLLLKKNKRVCKKTIFPFAQILWVCWLAVHPIEIGEKRRAKVFNFFTKPLLLLWLYFLMLTDLEICIYSWTTPPLQQSEVIQCCGQNTDVGYPHPEEGGGWVDLLWRTGGSFLTQILGRRKQPHS